MGEGAAPLPRTTSSMSASSENLDAQLSQGAAAKRKGRFQIVDVPVDHKARVARSSSLASFTDGRRATEGNAASPPGPSMSLLLPTLKVPLSVGLECEPPRLWSSETAAEQGVWVTAV